MSQVLTPVSATERNISLTSLVELLKTQNVRKYDVVLPANFLSVENGRLILNDAPEAKEVDAMNSILSNMGIGSISSDTHDNTRSFQMTDYCVGSVCEKLKIPRLYVDYLTREKHIDVVDYNMSEMFKRHGGKLFLRTFMNDDGRTGFARAILSDMFRVIDNLDVLFSCLTTIKKMGVNVKVESCDLTEKKLHARFYCPDIVKSSPDLLNGYRSPRQGMGEDTGVYAGFTITNSEIGASSFRIAPRLIIGACKNGMIFKKDSASWKHVGSRMNEGRVIVSEDTRRKEMELIMSQTEDAVRTFCSPDYLGKKVEELESLNKPIEKPHTAIEQVVKTFDLNKSSIDDLVNHFTKGADVTRFGIAQALTAFAYDYINADTAYDYESAATDFMYSNVLA